MRLIKKLTAKLQRHPKRIVFPDGCDHRVLQAAREFATKKLGAPILIGDRKKIKATALQLNISLDGIRVIDPEHSEEVERFSHQFLEKRRDEGLTLEEAEAIVKRPNYFAAMMLSNAQVDALVFGAGNAASEALPSLFKTIPIRANIDTAASVLILDIEEKRDFGIDGGYFLADCAVLHNPTAEQLVDVAISAATLAWHLSGETPRVAFLSFSTLDADPCNPSVSKMAEATRLTKIKAESLDFPIEIDGELQADAALDIYTAKQKGVVSEVAGRANVLIFPDLNSGNIAAKMTTILAGAYSYGHIITGLEKPAAQLSRGSSAHDIFATAVIMGAQATDHYLLFGE